MSAIRVMAPCMAMGEAAGRAAKMAVREGVAVADIDVEKLQEELLEKGAYLRKNEVTVFEGKEEENAVIG